MVAPAPLLHIIKIHLCRRVSDNSPSEVFDITSLKISPSSSTSFIPLVRYLGSSVFCLISESGYHSHTLQAIQYHNTVSLIAPFFHQNLPETGMDRNEDETITADRCNFMSIFRTHVVTGHSIIEVLQSVVVFPQTKFWRVANFLKSCHFLKSL